MARWSLAWRNDRGCLIPTLMRGGSSDVRLEVDRNAIHFEVPAGRHAYLTTKPSTNFAEPPPDDVFGLQAGATHGLSGTAVLSGGEVTFSFLMYDDRRLLDSVQCGIATGRWCAHWRAPRRYRSGALALRLAGAGRLVLDDLQLWTLSAGDESPLGDALVRVGSAAETAWYARSDSAEELAAACRRAGIGRAWLMPCGAHPAQDVFDQFSAAGSDHRSGCFPVLCHRAGSETRAKYRTFELNQLELFWQLGRMSALALDDGKPAGHGEHILAWLNERGLPGFRRISSPDDLARLEQCVVRAPESPAMIYLTADAAGDDALHAALLAFLDSHPNAHLLSGPGWDLPALVRLIERFPSRVLFASHGRPADSGAERAKLALPNLSEETLSLFQGGNLRRLTEAVTLHRWAALQTGSGLRFPAVPRSATEVERQGFVVVPAEKLPPREFHAAKEFWADYGIRDFYKNYKPWASLLIDLLRELQPQSVLEFGCNVGRNLYALAEALPGTALTGIDINRQAIEWGKQQTGLDLRIGDENTLAAWPAGAFDLAFTVSVLDHIADISEVCHRLVRCARRYVLLLEVTLPVEGKVERHFDHAERRVRESTGASYSWDVGKYLGSEARVARLDCRPCYLHDGSLGPYYWRYLAFLREPTDG